MTSVGLRPLTPLDAPSVLALNAADVELVSPMDAVRYEYLCGVASIADAIEVDGRFAGFVLVMASGATYDSENFAWFTREVAEPFGYLDRIILAPSCRRLGVGGRVYDDVEGRVAASGRALMCLEVNIDPPNEPSLAFHRRRGYAEVGRLGDPGHVVALMTTSLAR